MTNKLWQKKDNQKTENIVEHYTAGEDIIWDQRLVAYDILGSIAHAKMLLQIKIISHDEYKQTHAVLGEIYKKYQEGNFFLKPGDEDVHTRIENEITAQYPVSGAKLHTGRSRNDQVLVDMRLYSKVELLKTALLTCELINEFISFTKLYEFTPMPGYTHMQQAMLSSVGLWVGQFAESLVDDIEILESAYEQNDQNPLGAGAGYGVSLPLDREYTTKLLGFAKVQINSLYTQNSRGKIESFITHALSQVMLTLGRFASDILLFTTAEFDFFKLEDFLTTGSSIMPQKKNGDIFELMRGRSKIIQHYGHAISDIVTALPSGYNRDLQEIKPLLMKSFDITQESLKVALLAVKNIKPKSNNLQKAITKDLFAAHHAYTLVKKGMPFREAYKKVGNALSQIPEFQAEKVLKETSHLGAAGNLNIKNIEKEIQSENKKWKEKEKSFDQIVNNLLI